MILGGDELSRRPERQQQHLLPGQRAELARLGPLRPREAIPGIHAQSDLHPEEPAGLPAPQVLPGAGDPRLERQGYLVPQPFRSRRCRTTTGTAGFVRCLGLRLAGDLIDDENERGEPVVGETLLLLLNGHWEPIDFTLPETKRGHIWDRLFDTAEPAPGGSAIRGRCAVSLQGPFGGLAGHASARARTGNRDFATARNRRRRGEAPPRQPPGADADLTGSARAARSSSRARHEPESARCQARGRGPRRSRTAQCLPESTYRLQLHAGFTFRDALAIVPYLRELGITHCYASPYSEGPAGQHSRL